MAKLELFPRDKIVGVFRGFQEGGLEFHADLVLPYKSEFQNVPMHGQFLLVQLETPDEAVLGRITSFSSAGKLSTGQGEEFNIRAVRENRPIPEDLREQYLKYKVNIRVLGVLRNSSGGKLTFVASHRRLPHVGSPVAFPSDQALQEIAGHNAQGAAIGFFALGEYIYAAQSDQLEVLEWMQVREPQVLVKFPIQSLVSRRSFIFARAGFGKSNLNKLLFSQLYRETPTVTKRGNRQVPVGTVIFDPDGEYFWPDDKGRPGLCDVPWLVDKLVVFTSRKSPSAYYRSFVAGGIRLDIRRLKPSDVIAIALGPERQEQQNVRKLRGLPQDRWEELVDLIDKNGNQAPISEIGRLLQLDEDKQEVEAIAARSNMTQIVRMIHDKGSQLMDMLLHALSEGKLCVVDVSQLRGSQALVLSGLILRRIFDRNQQEFTEAEPKTIPTIAVIEEAQSVLQESTTSTEPYTTWVKEGRKYDLGAVLVTQQPGSIPAEILSQGDNWFVFHLLSSGDLTSLRKANAHFSEDLLSVLLNEPIPGQGAFWSSVAGQPYPVSIRVLSFEKMCPVVDLNNSKPEANTFALRMCRAFQAELSAGESTLQYQSGAPLPPVGSIGETGDVDGEPADALYVFEQRAIEALRKDPLLEKLRGDGAAWGELKAFLLKELPSTLDDRSTRAYHLVAKALTEIIGPQNKDWYTYKHPERKTTYIKVGRSPD